jgi:hypothetical protein
MKRLKMSQLRLKLPVDHSGIQRGRDHDRRDSPYSVMLWRVYLDSKRVFTSNPLPMYHTLDTSVRRPASIYTTAVFGFT